MKAGLFIGIDTSNYTTSAAAVSVAGEVFCAKRLLAVPQGEKGMRQSDALFCHTRDLPEIVAEVIEKAKGALGETKVLGVAASSTPRRVEGSYMPCFLAGVNAAKSAASLLCVPYLSFSHQEGHIEAARFGAEQEGRAFSEKEFYAFHLSGGTTEFLHVREEGGRYQASLLAEALDLTCVQLIDRCGVRLGLGFPAGKELEALAEKSTVREKIKIPKKEGGINLSGFENKFEKKLAEGAKKEDLARYVFSVTEEAIRSLLSFGEEGVPVLFSGGVASSHLLKSALQKENHFFAPPIFCADNAIGIARLCKKGVGNG
jgi:N6-L-threonylcarbamoyladenine synthase